MLASNKQPAELGRLLLLNGSCVPCRQLSVCMAMTLQELDQLTCFVQTVPRDGADKDQAMCIQVLAMACPSREGAHGAKQQGCSSVPLHLGAPRCSIGDLGWPRLGLWGSAIELQEI